MQYHILCDMVQNEIKKLLDVQQEKYKTSNIHDYFVGHALIKKAIPSASKIHPSLQSRSDYFLSRIKNDKQVEIDAESLEKALELLKDYVMFYIANIELWRELHKNIPFQKDLLLYEKKDFLASIRETLVENLAIIESKVVSFSKEQNSYFKEYAKDSLMYLYKTLMQMYKIDIAYIRTVLKGKVSTISPKKGESFGLVIGR